MPRDAMRCCPRRLRGWDGVSPRWCPTWMRELAFGNSTRGLPTIGPVPGLRHCFAVLGYGGNGITFSMMAAQMLRNLLVDGEEPDLDLVRFRGSRARSSPTS
jgi:glycine/D-amino acid oxidase-like deaminating enzyme